MPKLSNLDEQQLDPSTNLPVSNKPKLSNLDAPVSEKKDTVPVTGSAISIGSGQSLFMNPETKLKMNQQGKGTAFTQTSDVLNFKNQQQAKLDMALEKEREKAETTGFFNTIGKGIANTYWTFASGIESSLGGWDVLDHRLPEKVGPIAEFAANFMPKHYGDALRESAKAGAFKDVKTPGVAQINNFLRYLDNHFGDGEDKVGNWFTRRAAMVQAYNAEVNHISSRELAKEIRDPETGKVIREEWDFAALVDPAYWWQNLTSLTGSIGGFAAGGGLISKVGKLARLPKTLNVMAGAWIMTEAEAIGVAESVHRQVYEDLMHQNVPELKNEEQKVYDEAYNSHIEELGPARARFMAQQAKLKFRETYVESFPDQHIQAMKAAGKGAEAAIMVNAANFFLNLTAQSAFLKGASRPSRELAKPSLFGSGKELLLEGAQEYIEEGVVNNIAEKAGMAIGHGQYYSFSDAWRDATSKSAVEQGFWGMVGGMGQSGITNTMTYRDNAFTGKGNSRMAQYEKQMKFVDKWNKIGEAAGSKDLLAEVANFGASMEEIKLIQLQEQALRKAGKPDEADRLRDKIVHNQAFTAFQSGTTEALIRNYQRVADNEKTDNRTRKEALRAIKEVTSLENIYNDSVNKYVNGKSVFRNRANDYLFKQMKSDLQQQIALKQAEAAENIDSALKQGDVTLSGKFTEKTAPGEMDIIKEGELAYDMNNLFDKQFEHESQQKIYDTFLEGISDETQGIQSVRQLFNLQHRMEQIDNAIHDNNKTYNELTSKKTQKELKASNQVLIDYQKAKPQLVANIDNDKYDQIVDGILNKYKGKISESKIDDLKKLMMQDKVSEQKRLKEQRKQAIKESATAIAKERQQTLNTEAATQDAQAIKENNQEVKEKTGLQSTPTSEANKDKIDNVPQDIMEAPPSAPEIEANPDRQRLANEMMNDVEMPNTTPQAEVDEGDKLAPAEIRFTPEQKKKLKDFVSDYMISLEDSMGAKPTFEDFVRDYIKNTTIKQAEKYWNGLVEGWKANGFPETDFQTAYNNIFRDRKQIAQELASLFEENIITTDEQLEEATEEIVEDLQKKESTADEINNDNKPVYIHTGFTSTDTTPKLAHVSKKAKQIFTQNEDGSTTVDYEYIDEGLNQGEYVDSLALLDWNKYLPGEELTAFVPSAEELDKIKVPIYDEEGKRAKSVTFGDWVRDNNIDPNSQEYKDKIPIIVKDSSGKRVAFIHDTNWYHKNRFVETNIGKDIPEAKKNVREVRDKVLSSSNKATTLVITSNRSGNFEGLIIPKNQPKITVQEANPDAVVTVAKPDKDGQIRLFTGSNTKFEGVLENDLEKLYHAENKGRTYDIRRWGTRKNEDGTTTPTFMAFPASTETLSQEESLTMYQAVQAYLNQKNPHLSKEQKDKYDLIKDQIAVATSPDGQKATGIDIYTVGGIKEFLSQFVHIRSSDNPHDIFIKSVNKENPKQQKPYIGMSHQNVVFGITGENPMWGEKRKQDTKGVLGSGNYFGTSPNFFTPLQPKSASFAAKQYKQMMAHLWKVLPQMTRNTSLHALEKNRPQILIDQQGTVKSTGQNYNQKMMNTLKSNVKSYNIGTQDNPQFITRIQPVINYTLPEKLVPQKVEESQIPEVSEELQKQVEKLPEPPTPESTAPPFAKEEEFDEYNIPQTNEEMQRFIDESLEDEKKILARSKEKLAKETVPSKIERRKELVEKGERRVQALQNMSDAVKNNDVKNLDDLFDIFFDKNKKDRAFQEEIDYMNNVLFFAFPAQQKIALEKREKELTNEQKEQDVQEETVIEDQTPAPEVQEVTEKPDVLKQQLDELDKLGDEINALYEREAAEGESDELTKQINDTTDKAEKIMAELPIDEKEAISLGEKDLPKYLQGDPLEGEYGTDAVYYDEDTKTYNAVVFDEDGNVDEINGEPGEGLDVLEQKVKEFYEEQRSKEPALEEADIDVAAINEILNELSNMLPPSLDDSDLKFAPAELTPEQVKNMVDAIDRIEGINPADNYYIVDFIFNQVASSIDIDKGSAVDKEATLKKIRENYDKKIDPIKKKLEEQKAMLEKVFRAAPAKFPRIPDVLGRIDAAMKQFKAVEDNYDKLESAAFAKLKKYSGITEVQNDEDVNEAEHENNERVNNFSKTSLEENGKMSSSYRMKRFFSGIQDIGADGKVKTVFLGLPSYVGFDTVYNTLAAKLANAPANYDSMMAILKQHQESFPWISEVMKQLDEADNQIKAEFVSLMAKHSLDMNFMMYAYDKRTNSYTLKVFNTNSNAITQMLQSGWIQNFRNSKLAKPMGSTYEIDDDEVQRLIDTYEGWFDDPSVLSDKLIPKIPDSALPTSKAWRRAKIINPSFAKAFKKKTIYRFTKNGVEYTVEKLDTPNEYKVQRYAGASAVSEVMHKGYWDTSEAKRKEALKELDAFFDAFGIGLSEQTIKNIMGKGLYHRSRMIRFKDMFAKGESPGLFSILKNKLDDLAKKKGSAMSIEQEGVNPLRDDVIKSLAREESKHTQHTITNSFRDAGKSIYGFTAGKFVTDRVDELKNNENVRNNLKSISFSKNSLWLMALNDPDFREKFGISHLGLTAMKEQGKAIFGDNGITNLADADHEITKIGMFQDTQQGDVGVSSDLTNNIDNRMATMFFPTMSDKTTMTLLKTLVLKLNNQHFEFAQDGSAEFVGGTPPVLKTMYEQMVKPELERIVAYHQRGIKTDIKGYDDGAKMFLFLPDMNNLTVNIETTVGEGKDATTKVVTVPILEAIEDYPDKHDVAWVEEKVMNQIYEKLNKYLNSELQRKMKVWEDNGYITVSEGTKEDLPARAKMLEDQGYAIQVDGEKIIGTKFFDAKYMGKLGGSPQEKIKVAALDFIINSMISNANAFMTIAGDPAMFYKSNDTNPVVMSQETFVNVGKRLAAMIAPGTKLADSDTSSYKQIFINDRKSVSENIKYLTKLLDGREISDSDLRMLNNLPNMDKAVARTTLKELQKKYPNSGDYFDIEGADAQEYTTWQEHLYMLEKMGRTPDVTVDITPEEIRAARELFKSGTPLDKMTEKQRAVVKKVLQPVKPVYAGNVYSPHFDAMRVVYIKTSSFPLIPQMTAGLELDKLRKGMEAYEKKSGKNIRASHMSGNKVGGMAKALDVFNPDGTVKDFVDANNELTAEALANMDATSLELPRKYFRIQQDVPFKSAKRKEDTVTLGTQTVKLLFGDDVMKMTGFKYDGKTMTGEALQEEYRKVFDTIIKDRKKKLFDEFGLDAQGNPIDPKVTVLKIQNVLKEEAENRGYPKQDIEGLSVYENPGTGEVEFVLPPWTAANSNRYEALLMSIVTNRIAKIKMPGNTYVVGSQEGFKFQKGLEGIDKSKIVWLPGFEGELKAAKTDASGLTKAQVLVPSKFRGPDGTLIDLFEKDEQGEYKYVIKDEKGKFTLNEEMFSEDLLSLTSFRIPTSGHVSLSEVEIAGFLPYENGDLMIVPKNFTVQKGLDFDVDKETTYQLWHVQDENGKFVPLDEAYKLEDIKKYEEQLANFDKEYNEGLSAEDIEDVITISESEEISTMNLRQLLDIFDVDARKRQAKNEIRAKIRKIKEYKEKILQNQIVRIHRAVLTNPSPAMQKRINKVLSIDYAKDQAKMIDGIIKGLADNTYFTPLSDEYQKDKMFLGASGKIGTGAYSLDVVSQSLFEQSNKRGEALQLTRDVVTEEGKVIKVPESFTFGTQTADGKLGKTKTIKGGRSIADVLAERQNIATDNEKEQVMGRVNLNSITLDVDKVLTLLGFDKGDDGNSISFLFLSQPIIREYVKMMGNARANTSDMGAEAEQYVISELIKKFDPEGAFNPADENMVMEADKRMSNASLLSDLQAETPNGLNQAAVLYKFIKLRDYGVKVRAIQTSINVDSKGLGKSFFEVLEKSQALQSLPDNSLVQNAEKLVGIYERITLESTPEYIENRINQGYVRLGNWLILPTTVAGSFNVHTVGSAIDLFSDAFPYETAVTTKIFNELTPLMLKADASESKRVETKMMIFREMKKYLYSSNALGIFTESAYDERKRLFFDKPASEKEPGKQSLATYLREMMTTLPERATAKQKAVLQRFIKNNKLLGRFTYSIESGGEMPSKIEFNNSAGENFDEEYLYNSLVELIAPEHTLPDFNGQKYDTRKLAQDLITYAFLEGGIQEAVQFVKYIPISYMNNTPFAPLFRMLQRNHFKVYHNGVARDVFGTDPENKDISVFTMQFAQNNPHRMPKGETPLLMDAIGGKENAYRRLEFKTNQRKLEDLMTFQLDHPNPPKFMSFYASSLPAGQKKFMLFYFDGARYRRLPVYGTFGMSEYNATYSRNQAPTLQRYLMTMEDSLVNLPGKVVPPSQIDANNLFDVVQGNKSFTEAFGFPGVEKQPPTTSPEEFFKLETGNIETIIQEIINTDFPTPESKAIAELAKVLSPFIDNSVKVELINQGRVAEGVYSPKHHKITINKAALDGSMERTAIAIMHEFIHSITYHEVQKWLNPDGSIKPDAPQTIRRLNRLYERTIKHFGKDKIDKLKQKLADRQALEFDERRKQYGATDLHEFITMVMTQPEFQKEMAGVAYDSSGKSLWERFKEVLNEILHLAGVKADHDTVLAQGMAAVLELVKETKTPKKKPPVVQSTPIKLTTNEKVGQMSEYFNDFFKLTGLKMYSPPNVASFNGMMNYLSEQFTANIQRGKDEDFEFPFEALNRRHFGVEDGFQIDIKETTNFIYVDNLFLPSQIQGRGVGKLILDMIKTVSDKPIALYSDTDSRQAKFFEREGFIKNENSELLSQVDGMTVYEFYPTQDIKIQQKKNAEKLPPKSMSEITNFSGKAKGADTAWAEAGDKFGIGKQVDFTPNDYDALPKEGRDVIEGAYQKAAQAIGRTPLSADSYGGKLVRRDYLQARNADAVFAVSNILKVGESGKKINPKTGKPYPPRHQKQVVDGGTGYAVEMAIQMDKPVYVFHQGTHGSTQMGWYTWNGDEFVKVDTPVLTKNFAGIGSRDISIEGYMAIQDVFNATKKMLDSRVSPEEMRNVNMDNAMRQEFPEFNDRLIYEMRQDKIEFTNDQQQALGNIASFIDEDDTGNAADQYFLLAGYAGTGKTTIVENIANYAAANGLAAVVLAPTNAAVKRLDDKMSDKNVDIRGLSTIHAALYGEPDPDTGEWIPKTMGEDSLFIIDESSMIEEKVLLEFMDALEETNSKAIFVGDGFQLEPVGKDPKLFKWEKTNRKFQQKNFSQLSEVKRQDEGMILTVATKMRMTRRPEIPSTSTDDMIIEKGKYQLKQKFYNSVRNGENSVFITATNDVRVEVNKEARHAKLGKEKADSHVLFAGETLTGIANSNKMLNAEFVTVVEDMVVDEVFDVEVDFSGYQGAIESKMVRLYSGTVLVENAKGIRRKIPMLMAPGIDKSSLYHGQLTHSFLKNKTGAGRLARFMTRDERGNIKMSQSISIATYGYAVTAHKSQGNEWDKVFLDAEWIAYSWDSARWLYTAITRAQNKIHISSDPRYVDSKPNNYFDDVVEKPLPPKTPTDNEKRVVDFPYIAVNDMFTKTGSLGGARADGTIRLATDFKEEHFWSYIQGMVASTTSVQKKMVLDQMEQQHGVTMADLKNLLNTRRKIMEFILLHEKSHQENNDHHVYFKEGKDLLTPDKIAIETRANMDAYNRMKEFYREKLAPAEVSLESLGILEVKCKL